MSLSDLTEASHVNKGHISSIELGLASITIQTISRLAKGLGLPPLYLLVFAADDDRDAIVELVRRLPAHEVVKLRRTLTTAAKEFAKAAAKATRLPRRAASSPTTGKA
jgi:transcriptional regulator with XRE-family HTH domain